MKRIKYFLLTLLTILYFLPISVNAKGNITVSTTNLNVIKGSTSSFTITANNSAGRIEISSSNPSVATVSESSIFLDMQSNTITVKGNKVGTATIKVYASDVTTYDDEDLSGKTYQINVTVSEKKQPTTDVTQNQHLSTNNKIKELKVKDYNLQKVDDNNYTLTVDNDVTSIDIEATPEDKKSKISGDGSHELNVGENNIEVKITSESGVTNKINVKVTRKDGYYLEDLDKVLNNSKVNDINIIIKSDSSITKETLGKIKNSKKIVKLNYFDDTKKLIYSWQINGEKIKNINEFLPSISYISDYKKEISKLSNYANGLHLNFMHTGNLPKDTTIKVYVGDKFDNEDIVNLYHYNKEDNKLEFVKDNLKVTEGYIEFNIEHCSEYFITMSNITTNKTEEKVQTSSIDTFMIISIVELLIIITMIVIYFLKIKPLLKNNPENITTEQQSQTIENINNNLLNQNIQNISNQPLNQNINSNNNQV